MNSTPSRNPDSRFPRPVAALCVNAVECRDARGCHEPGSGEKMKLPTDLRALTDDELNAWHSAITCLFMLELDGASIASSVRLHGIKKTAPHFDLPRRF